MDDTHKAKINLQLELELCPYWDAKIHTRTHDCHDCHCASEGNSIDNAQCGVMVNGDRYCMLDCNIYGEVIKKLEEYSMRNIPIDDPTGVLEFMRNKIFCHVNRLQEDMNSHLHMTGDYIEIYIKRLEEEINRLKGETKNV